MYRLRKKKREGDQLNFNVIPYHQSVNNYIRVTLFNIYYCICVPFIA